MTKKNQVLAILTTTEALLFVIALIVVFTITTGIFTKSSWTSESNQPSNKSFTKESLATLSEKNMLHNGTSEQNTNGIFLPRANAATLDQDIEKEFSENEIMIRANELLIFDEL